jgi:hypothetical protein
MINPVPEKMGLYIVHVEGSRSLCNRTAYNQEYRQLSGNEVWIRIPIDEMNHKVNCGITEEKTQIAMRACTYDLHKTHTQNQIKKPHRTC